MDPRVLEEQTNRNRDSRERWIRYAAHRSRITHLILQSRLRGGRVLILGAGNCNDIDLKQLLEQFVEVHLLDFDGEALQWGVRQQGLSDHDNIFTYSGCDVTGIAGKCSAWRAELPSPVAEVRLAISLAAAQVWPVLDAAFDVVASVGLLSQLIEMITTSLGTEHPTFLELLSVVRSRHLQLLMHAVRPGGCGILVTEIVSSASCPELAAVPESGLLDLLRRSINAGNFFTGLNPAVLELLWRQSPELAPLTERVVHQSPWLWDFGPRIYACCAFLAVRADS